MKLPELAIGKRETIELEYRGFVTVTRLSVDVLRINLFFIDSEYQRKGYGSYYIKKLVRIARAKGIKYLVLGASSEEAIKFFKRLGFHHVRNQPRDEMVRKI